MTTHSKTRLGNGFDARIALLAARQGGAVSRQQALDLGANDTTISRRLHADRWQRRYPGVHVVGGSPPSWMQDVWCASLAVGPKGVVTHTTALHLHGIHLLPRRPITLTAAHGCHARLDGVVLHQIDDLDRHRITAVAGLPVSTPERTAIELAAELNERLLARIVDELLAAKCTSYAALAAAFREVIRPGKPGMTKLARVLDERSDGYVPPGSELERALFDALKAGGLPDPVRQFRLPGRGAVKGLVDGAYPLERVILEADGRRWHTRVADFKRDERRTVEAARVGWLTLRFEYELITRHPDLVCAAVRDVLAQRGDSSRPDGAEVIPYGDRKE